MLLSATFLVLFLCGSPLAVMGNPVSIKMLESTDVADDRCALVAKTRVRETKLEPSTKPVAMGTAALPTLKTSWFASPFDDCDLAKDGSAIRRRTLECLDVFTLSPAPASCTAPKPCANEACTCGGVELCTKNGQPSQIAECPEGASKSWWPDTSNMYEELGCIASAASANTSQYMDFTCMQPTASPCRDGLPFYSFVEYNLTAEACLDFCLGKGFDLFGVLSNLECRCGGSAGNEGAWHTHNKRRELLLPLNSIRACTGTEALKVYRYTGHFVAGSVPPMALRMKQSDEWYVGSVLAGRHSLPEFDEEAFPFRQAGRPAGGRRQPAASSRHSAWAQSLRKVQTRACFKKGNSVLALGAANVGLGSRGQIAFNHPKILHHMETSGKSWWGYITTSRNLWISSRKESSATLLI